MDSFGHRQCRHPAQPMGGVCAACLKERLSNISCGLRCGSYAAISNSDVSDGRSSSLNAPPLKQLLGDHLVAPPKMSNEVMLLSQDITEARQSIAYLIEKDMVEAHRRYSDVASRCCYEASHNQLLRSKSTSQMDVYSRLDGMKSSQLISHQRPPRSGGKNMTIKCFASSAMKPLVHHHHLQKVTTPSPQCHSNGGKQTMMRFELQDKTAQPLLTRSKSTGWIINRHLTHDRNNKRSERRSPIDLLSWHKKRKTSSVSNASLEDSAPLMMMAPCSRKDGARGSIMWRPLKILFRWRGTSGKPSWGTPRSMSSSSSSCMTQCAPEKNLPDEVSLPKLGDHVEPERLVVCGPRLHRLLSQVRPQGSSHATVMGLDALHNDVQSSILEEGSRRRAGGEVMQGTSVVLSSSRLLKVAESTSSSVRESSTCSALSSPSPFLPSFTTGLDTSMMYSNSKVMSGSGCVQVSIAALISMDVNTTSPLKVSC